MKKILLVLGVALIIFGLVDLGGSYADFDLWGKLGIQLPDVIWKYSSYIELALGFGLFSLGKNSEDDE